MEKEKKWLKDEINEIRIEKSEEDLIDVIKKNGRLIEKVGIGMKEKIGKVEL
jgi:hypothetical protein